MTAGSYVYIGPQGIVHGTTVLKIKIYLVHYDFIDTVKYV